MVARLSVYRCICRAAMMRAAAFFASMAFSKLVLVIQNSLCRTASKAEHRGTVKMRCQIFHQFVPVGTAAQLIQHLVELFIQRKDFSSCAR